MEEKAELVHQGLQERRRSLASVLRSGEGIHGNERCASFCGTWNVNGKVEEDFYIGTWLDSGLQPVPDILAIGLQEMVDLSAVNAVMESAVADNKLSQDGAVE